MIGELENAVIARLKAASDGNYLGYKYRTFETYPADWDAYLTTKVLNWPAVWVTFGGMTEIERVADGSYVMAHFGIVVAAQNLRNETMTRQGGPNGTAEPGSYQLAWDVIGLINGSDLGLDWLNACEFKALKFVAATPAMLQKSVSMLAVEFTTRFLLMPDRIDLTGEFTGDLATFDVKWDVPPFTSPRPPDWTPDSEDQLTLPIQEP